MVFRTKNIKIAAVVHSVSFLLLSLCYNKSEGASIVNKWRRSSCLRTAWAQDHQVTSRLKKNTLGPEYVKSSIKLGMRGLLNKVKGFSPPVEPPLGAFPFQASLMQLLDDKKSYHTFCGGSLIHPEWVLTAAHCIQLDAESPAMKANEVYVAVGSVYRNARGAQIIRARQLKIHPTYLKTGRNDIGLIKLRTRAKLGKNVKLARLHTNNKESLIGTTSYLTGFGIINDFYQVPEKLRKATLHVDTYEKCFNDKQSEGTELCARSTVAEGKACKGDSGGPLTMKKNGKLYQIGITSRLALLPICRVGFNNSVYTKVAAYISWISKVTGVNFMKYNRS